MRRIRHQGFRLTRFSVVAVVGAGFLLSACGGGTEPRGPRVAVAEYTLQTVGDAPLPYVVDAPAAGGTLAILAGKIVLYNDRSFIHVSDKHDTRDGGARAFSDTVAGRYTTRGDLLIDLTYEAPSGPVRVPGLFEGDARRLLWILWENRGEDYQKQP